MQGKEPNAVKICVTSLKAVPCLIKGCLVFQLDTSRISRLLDNLSDDEMNDFVQRRNVDDAFNVSTTSKNHNADPISNENLAVPIVSSEDDIVVDVEDLLQLALDERKGKQEAKQVKK